jgi:hypothetical protein
MVATSAYQPGRMQIGCRAISRQEMENGATADDRIDATDQVQDDGRIADLRTCTSAMEQANAAGAMCAAVSSGRC